MERTGISNKEFEIIINNTYAYLYAFSYRLSGSSEDARDLIQETYFKAWQNWAHLKNRDKLIPWLKKICQNIFFDNNRKFKKKILGRIDFSLKEREISAEIPTPEDELLADETISKIQRQFFTIIASILPLYQRIAIIMVDITKISIKEVAVLINRSLPATKALLYRARKKINDNMDTYNLILSESFYKCKSWITFANNAQMRSRYFKSIIQSQMNNKINTIETIKRIVSLFKDYYFLYSILF